VEKDKILLLSQALDIIKEVKEHDKTLLCTKSNKDNINLIDELLECYIKVDYNKDPKCIIKIIKKIVSELKTSEMGKKTIKSRNKIEELETILNKLDKQ